LFPLHLVLVREWLHCWKELQVAEYADVKQMTKEEVTHRRFLMEVGCGECSQMATVHSDAKTAVSCGSCNYTLCTPTGGFAWLVEGCS